MENQNLIIGDKTVITKEEIAAKVGEFVIMCESGEYDNLGLWVSLKAAQKVIEEAVKAVEPYAGVEADQYATDKVKVFNYHGAEIKRTTTGVKYHFEDNEKWQKANEKVADAKAHLKGVETELKAKGDCWKEGKETYSVTFK